MEVDNSDPNPFSFDSGKAKLKSIQELESGINKLQAFVSDQCAEDVGHNCYPIALRLNSPNLTQSLVLIENR